LSSGRWDAGNIRGWQQGQSRLLPPPPPEEEEEQEAGGGAEAAAAAAETPLSALLNQITNRCSVPLAAQAAVVESALALVGCWR